MKCKGKKYKKKKAGKKTKGIGMIGAIVAGLIIGIMVLFSLNTAVVSPVIEPILEPLFKPTVEEEQRSWQPKYLPYLGDRNPAGGDSGWMNMSIYENVSNPTTYYARNLTNNASSYEWTNTNNTHAGSNVPHTTEVAIVYKIRVNVSDGFASGNSTWMPTWIRCNITSAGLSLNDVGMDRYVIGDNATYMWLHFVYRDGAEITPGQNVTTCQFYVDMYQ